jgi:hypothetical protein
LQLVVASLRKETPVVTGKQANPTKQESKSMWHTHDVPAREASRKMPLPSPQPTHPYNPACPPTFLYVSHKSRADRTRLGDTGLVFIGPSGVQVSEFGLNKKEEKEVRAGSTRMPGKIMTSGMGNHKVLFNSVCHVVHMLRFPIQ